MKNAAVLLAAGLFSGCATLTSNEMQQLTLETKSEQGERVAQASCYLKNDKGQWEAKSPVIIAVRRSAEDLMVECKKDGQPDGFVRAVSRAAGGMWGNIIFGGGVGALIDHSKGTGYNYPDNLTVMMGKTTTIDRAQSGNEQQQQQQQPQEQPQKSAQK